MALTDELDALRRRFIGRALDVGIRTASRVGRWHPASRRFLEPVETAADLAYRETGNPAHHLDVVRPRAHAGDPRPVVLYLHGGGFRILSKETHWMMAGAFAAHGWVVFNANYRLSGEAPFPAAVEDAAAAYRWVIEHAAEWGGDPSRMVLAGESAGANLVTALAIACCFRRTDACVAGVFELGVVPRAVVPMCGLLEVSRWERYADVPMARFVRERLEAVCVGYLGAAAGEDGPHLALANPLAVLESDLEPDRPLPPFAASVGTRDPVLDDTRRLERALAYPPQCAEDFQMAAVTLRPSVYSDAKPPQVLRPDPHAMARGPDEGVTDHRGQVFGHPGLYVADGSLYPRSPGIAPSLTIAALAERQAQLID